MNRVRANAWNRDCSYIMIDEYQDTNRSQYELMRPLTQLTQRRLRGGRRGSVHLQLARRGHPQHPRL
jgi:superfamily I DNA/RNA helicase